MRAIVSIAVMLVSGLAAAAPAEAAVVDVLTGDVIAIDNKQWHIAFIQAPQLEYTCEEEAKLGLIAREKLAAFLSQGEMEIRPTARFDLEHRVMAFVSINGEDVGEKMIAARLAQRYDQARPLCLLGDGHAGKPPSPPRKPWPQWNTQGGMAMGQSRPHSLPPPPTAGIRR